MVQWFLASYLHSFVLIRILFIRITRLKFAKFQEFFKNCDEPYKFLKLFFLSCSVSFVITWIHLHNYNTKWYPLNPLPKHPSSLPKNPSLTYQPPQPPQMEKKWKRKKKRKTKLKKKIKIQKIQKIKRHSMGKRRLFL